MAYVYILYSKKLNKYYTGSCLELSERLEQHRNKKIADSFTAKTDDWDVFYQADDLEYKQARKIELHIKKMKSRKYIEDLKNYSELLIKLKEKYKRNGE